MNTGKIFLSIVIGTIVLGLMSCADFLKDDSGDLLIPKRVSEYQAVLFGEGYPQDFVMENGFVSLMTDDVEVLTGKPWATPGYDTYNINEGRGAFMWGKDIEYYIPRYGQAYEARYSNIMTCNTVIEEGEKMVGSSSEINDLLGQAHTIRAFSYFHLVNLFAVPYNKLTAATDPGVAIKLKPHVTREGFVRSTVKDVYDLILSDLTKAIEYFEKSDRRYNKFLASKDAARFLLARVKLYTQEWQDVIKIGEEMMTEARFELYDISKKDPETMGANNATFSFISPENTEVYFSFGGARADYHPYMSSYGDGFKGPFFSTSQTKPYDLISLYEEGDMRLFAFFRKDTPLSKPDDKNPTHTHNEYYKTPFKYVNQTRQFYRECFRAAELLLNVAEASVHVGSSIRAIELLNMLRKARITPETYTALSTEQFSDNDTLLKFVKEERRRELCFEENHRWYDLRREGMPRIEHWLKVSETAPGQTFVLEQGDQNYTLALPSSERGISLKMKDHIRRDILPY